MAKLTLSSRVSDIVNDFNDLYDKVGLDSGGQYPHSLDSSIITSLSNLNRFKSELYRPVHRYDGLTNVDNVTDGEQFKQVVGSSTELQFTFDNSNDASRFDPLRDSPHTHILELIRGEEQSFRNTTLGYFKVTSAVDSAIGDDVFNPDYIRYTVKGEGDDGFGINTLSTGSTADNFVDAETVDLRLLKYQEITKLPKPDWTQSDSNHPDFINNKESFIAKVNTIESDLGNIDNLDTFNTTDAVTSINELNEFQSTAYESLFDTSDNIANVNTVNGLHQIKQVDGVTNELIFSTTVEQANGIKGVLTDSNAVIGLRNSDASDSDPNGEIGYFRVNSYVDSDIGDDIFDIDYVRLTIQGQSIGKGNSLAIDTGSVADGEVNAQTIRISALQKKRVVSELPSPYESIRKEQFPDSIDLTGKTVGLTQIKHVIEQSPLAYSLSDNDQLYNALRALFEPTGLISIWPGDPSIIPDGWLECAGALISRANYSALFGIIGERYGAGDGSSTFKLPDFRGKVARGKTTSANTGDEGGNDSVDVSVSGNTGNRTVNISGNTNNHTLTPAQMPSHDHRLRSANVNYFNADGLGIPNSNTVLGGPLAGATTDFYSTNGLGLDLVENTGGNQGHKHGVAINNTGNHNHSISLTASGVDITPSYTAQLYVIRT